MRIVLYLLLIVSLPALLCAQNAHQAFVTVYVSAPMKDGFVDTNNTFRNTGAFVVKSSNGQIFPICSGTLITPNVFLTASHCTVFFTQELAPAGDVAYVSLDQSIPFGELTSNKTQLLPVAHVVSNPGYNQSQSDSGDIAVLILARTARYFGDAWLGVNLGKDSAGFLKAHALHFLIAAVALFVVLYAVVLLNDRWRRRIRNTGGMDF